MCDLALEKWDPVKQNPRPQKSPATSQKSRVIQAELKRAVWRRHDGQCAICRSRHALQVNHVKPYSVGDETTAGNLRLLCRHCNQRQAIEKLGLKKMQKYLNSDLSS